MTRNSAYALAHALDRATDIMQEFSRFPTQGFEVQCLLRRAHSDAEDTRRALECELEKLPEHRRDAVICLLQRELTETLRTYRLALSTDAALQQREAALRCGDHDRFRRAVGDTIGAAEDYLRANPA